MSLLLLLGAWVLWLVLWNIVKEIYIGASASVKDRRDHRIMLAYRRDEEARYHAANLAAIDRTLNKTAQEMAQVAAEARGEMIECSPVELSAAAMASALAPIHRFHLSACSSPGSDG
jgi:hypothetical protein